MPEQLVISVLSLIAIALAGMVSIGLARFSNIHPAWFFFFSGTALFYLLPFSLPAQNMLAQLAELGALFLVFLAALDIDWNSRFRLTATSLVFALLVFFLTALPVALLLYFFFPGTWIAAASGALIVAVHAPGARFNLAGNAFRSNQVANKWSFAALVSEFTALVFLVLLLAIARSHYAYQELLQSVVGLLLLFLVLLSVIPQALRFLLRRVGEESYALFYLVLAIVLAVVLAIRAAGIEPVLGAYAAGFVLARFITQGSRILGRLRFLGLSLLNPAFYIYFGASGMLWQDLHWQTLAGALFLTIFVAALRYGLLRWTGDSGIGLQQLLSRNPLVLVLVYFASARGLLPHEQTQLLLWHLLACEILVALLARAKAAATDAEILPPQPRVLLPLSNPETMLPLLNLGTHLGEFHRAPKLYPLNIVPDDAAAEERIQTVEARFNEIIPMYNAREQPIELTARIENDRIRAVSHAARELLCDRILLGLGAVPTLSRPQGYSFLESLVTVAQDRMVIAAHLSVDLSITGMINVIIPHARLAENAAPWLTTVLVLAHRLRADLTLNGDTETLAQLKAILDDSGQGRLCRFRAGHIHAGLDLLTLDAKSDTLSIAILERASLFPNEKIFARLPEMMVRAYADRNFILLYPPTTRMVQQKQLSVWKRFRRYMGF